MKIYNENKTKELAFNELDFEKGYLKADKLFVRHHDSIPEVKAKTVEQIVEELRSRGQEVEKNVFNGKWYKTLAKCEKGGKLVEQIFPIEYAPEQVAWDEYEDIQIYALYTEEELAERRLNDLRAIRERIFISFDTYKCNVYYGIEKESLEQREQIFAWYDAMKNLEDWAFENIPNQINYYYRRLTDNE